MSATAGNRRLSAASFFVATMKVEDAFNQVCNTSRRSLGNTSTRFQAPPPDVNPFTSDPALPALLSRLLPSQYANSLEQRLGV